MSTSLDILLQEHPDLEQIISAWPELRILGKGNKIRPFPIQPELSDYIKWFVKEVRPNYIRRPMRKRDWSQPLIFKESGEPYDRRSLYRRINRLRKRAGLEKRAGVHRCRHSFGTHAYRSGMDLVTLQDLMGHSDINTTTVYAKADRSKTLEMLKKVRILSVWTSRMRDQRMRVHLCMFSSLAILL